MNLAILLQFGISFSLKKFARLLPSRKTTRSYSSFAHPTETLSITPALTATTPQAGVDALCAVHRPLRVVRVLEAGQPRSHVGRMKISGCMADVCAELDRLVARESALS